MWKAFLLSPVVLMDQGKLKIGAGQDQVTIYSDGETGGEA